MTINRRSFCRNTTLAAAGLLLRPRFSDAPFGGKLSFSTLGCPDWDFGKITQFAAANGYAGLEFRGIRREMDLTKAEPFRTPENLRASLQLMQVLNLSTTDLGSSCELHHADPATRTANLDEAKRFIELAEKMNCPYVRVFPNKLPPGEDKQAVIERIAKGLRSLGEFAQNTRVTVLMETHGDFAHADDTLAVLKAAAHPKTGLVWDVVNMWSVTGEAPAAVYAKLKEYVHHTHLKDLTRDAGGDHYTLFGKGIAPVWEAVDALVAGGYGGYYSFEWEKLWHPEIAEPEVAIAAFPQAFKEHYS